MVAGLLGSRRAGGRSAMGALPARWGGRHGRLVARMTFVDVSREQIAGNIDMNVRQAAEE